MTCGALISIQVSAASAEQGPTISTKTVTIMLATLVARIAEVKRIFRVFRMFM